MKIIAVTACPTGIAHSQMAAENLETAGEEMGHDVHVEIQGAMGAENELTDDDVAAADVVVIASDTTVHTDRFEGVPIVKGTVKDAVNDAEGLIEEAEAEVGAADGASEQTAGDAAAAESTAETGTESASTADTAGGTDDRTSADAGEDASSARTADDRRDREGLVGKIRSLFS